MRTKWPLGIAGWAFTFALDPFGFAMGLRCPGAAAMRCALGLGT